jgi:membrane-anchored protein YejM (alkaline phosphatase superfamily)
LSPENVPGIPGARLRASIRLWHVNLLLVLPVAFAYWRHVPPDLPLRARAFACLALISSLGLMSLPVVGLLAACARFVPAPRLVAVLHGVLWAAWQLYLFVDTRIYALFRFHFNGTIWELLTTPGTGDSIHLGWRGPSIVVGIAVAVGIAEALLFARWAKAPARVPIRWPARRPALATILVLAAVVVTEKGMHARADLLGDRAITSLSVLPPAYQIFTVRRVAREWFHFEPARVAMDLPASQGLLQYPSEPVRLPAGGPRPDIVVLVIDSLRRDALTPEVMPRLTQIATQGRRFDDHLSCANNTRFGIFGLMYGLHGTYWVPTYDARRRPALVEALDEAGYDMAVFATASMNSPPIRQTSFAGLGDRVHDALATASGQPGDVELGREAVAWLRERHERGDARPLFLFAFLDASHQTYSYPEEEEHFKPSAREVDYLDLSADLTADQLLRLHNRYLNAVRHADRVVGEIVDELDADGSSGPDGTLLLVTGDHGEEFGENGFWGHNSNFSAAQVAVPFVARGPIFVPGVETGPTSHLDACATLLEACGVPRDRRPSYSLGGSLLEVDRNRPVRVVSGWDRLALWTGDNVLWLPMSGHLGTTDVRSHDWKPVADPDLVLRQCMPIVMSTVTDCQRFLR